MTVSEHSCWKKKVWSSKVRIHASQETEVKQSNKFSIFKVKLCSARDPYFWQITSFIGFQSNYRRSDHHNKSWTIHIRGNGNLFPTDRTKCNNFQKMDPALVLRHYFKIEASHKKNIFNSNENFVMVVGFLIFDLCNHSFLKLSFC